MVGGVGSATPRCDRVSRIVVCGESLVDLVLDARSRDADDRGLAPRQPARGGGPFNAAIALGRRLGVELPIAREVHAALFEGKSVERCLVALLAREPREEAGVA